MVAGFRCAGTPGSRQYSRQVALLGHELACPVLGPGRVEQHGGHRRFVEQHLCRGQPGEPRFDAGERDALGNPVPGGSGPRFCGGELGGSFPYRRVDQKLAGGIDLHLCRRAFGALGADRKGSDLFDLVPEEVEAGRVAGLDREDIDDPTAHRKLTVTLHPSRPLISQGDETLHDRFEAVRVITAAQDDRCHRCRADPLHSGAHRRNDHHRLCRGQRMPGNDAVRHGDHARRNVFEWQRLPGGKMEGGAEEGSILRQLFGLTLPRDDTEDRPPEAARRSGEYYCPQRWGNDDSALERRDEVAAESVENGAERSRHEMGSYRRPVTPRRVGWRRRRGSGRSSRLRKRGSPPPPTR